MFNTCTRKQPLPRRLGGETWTATSRYGLQMMSDFSFRLGSRRCCHRKIPPKQLLHDCHPHDLAEFFADFMLNDFIGLVSHLHQRIVTLAREARTTIDAKTWPGLHSQAN